MKTKIFILISLTTCLMVFSQKDCTEPCNMQVEDYKIYTNSTYNGCVNDNQNYHGKGVEVMIIEENKKQTYNGCWKNGKRHGTGTLNFANGDKYEGEWKNGKMHGTGILNFGERRYEGEFYKNEFHGNGTLYSKNKYNQEEWWTGIWEEDEMKDGYWNYENHYNPDDIKIKDSEIGTISLPKDARGREFINVTFNNLTVPFKYDTAADYIVINNTVLRQLRDDGVKVTKLGNTREMSGVVSATTTEAYSINQLTVGNIEVNNVIVYVIPNEVSSVLMGEDFWNKFSRTIRCIDSEIGSEITIYK